MTSSYTPSKAERDANILKAEAEAERFRAEARKLIAEAEKAEAEALQASLLAAKSLADDEARKAGDEFHHVYRFTGEVNKQSVESAVKKLTEWHRLHPDCEIEIIFNSPGGEIIEGMRLFDFIVDLGQAGHKTTTGCTGWAASMAGILLQSGQRRYMTAESWMMMHRAAFLTWGKTYEIEDEVEWIKRIEERIIKIFASRSELTPQWIKRNWERKDLWFSSSEAYEKKLVDEVRSELGKKPVKKRRVVFTPDA